MSDERDEIKAAAAALGKRGGEVVSARYGKPFFEKIGNKGGNATKARYGADFYAEIGKKGGTENMRRHGTEHYQRIGKKGGSRVRELLARAKAIEVAENDANGNP